MPSVKAGEFFQDRRCRARKGRATRFRSFGFPDFAFLPTDQVSKAQVGAHLSLAAESGKQVVGEYVELSSRRNGGVALSLIAAHGI